MPDSSPVKRTPEGRRRAKAVIDFIERLTIPSGTGQGKPFKLEPFQKRFIRDVYESYIGDRRVVRRAILSMARKNGKTALIAAIVLAHLVGPEAVVHGEIYSAANDRDQAAIVYKFARQMVELEPELLAEIELVPSTKTMLARRLPTIMPPLSLDEALEVTAIHSVAGLVAPGTGLVASRPFRAPHHTISDVALVGGGVLQPLYDVFFGSTQSDPAFWIYTRPLSIDGVKFARPVGQDA